MAQRAAGERGRRAFADRARSTGALLAAILLAAGVLTGERAAASGREPALLFRSGEEAPRRVPLAELRERCGERTVELYDPGYGERKRYRACPLAAVLERGFGEGREALAGAHFFLHAADGYVKPAEGETLLAEGGYLAFAEAGAEGEARPFAPLGPRRIDPGPAYVVWTGLSPGERPERPWPWQLRAVERAGFEARYPHVLPRGEPRGSAAWRGLALFRRDCIACHSLNGEGGTVGPDLNVPRSIVEYRPESQIRAYVRNPAAFRYGSMPPNPQLSESELDDLLAYLRAMRKRKHDPGGRGAAR